MSEQPALGMPGVKRVVVNTEPSWKHHEIEITGYGDECVSSELICNAPLGSFCHARFDCDCEEYYDFGITDEGTPFHHTHEGERHEGALDKDFCNYRYHYEFFSNLFTGSIRVPVEMEWESGAGYSFTLRPQGQDDGHMVFEEMRTNQEDRKLIGVDRDFIDHERYDCNLGYIEGAVTNGEYSFRPACDYFDDVFTAGELRAIANKLDELNGVKQ